MNLKEKPVVENTVEEKPVKKKKGKSTRQKGNELQNKVVKILEALGYNTHNEKCHAKCIRIKGRPVWISGRNDIFSCVDVIAKKAGEPTRWIQVTAHSGKKKRLEDFKPIPWTNGIDSVELWEYKDGGKWDLFTYNIENDEFKMFGKISRGVIYTRGLEDKDGNSNRDEGKDSRTVPLDTSTRKKA